MNRKPRNKIIKKCRRCQENKLMTDNALYCDTYKKLQKDESRIKDKKKWGEIGRSGILVNSKTGDLK